MGQSARQQFGKLYARKHGFIPVEPLSVVQQPTQLFCMLTDKAMVGGAQSLDQLTMMPGRAFQRNLVTSQV
jgi:hypothetical protein